MMRLTASMSSATISSSGLQALARIPRLFEWDDDAQDVLFLARQLPIPYSRAATRGSQARFPRQSARRVRSGVASRRSPLEPDDA